MSFDPTQKVDWADRMQFDVYQAKLSAATGDFSYFNISGPRYRTDGAGADYFAVFADQYVEADSKKKLGEILVKAAEAIDQAVDNLAKTLENFKVPDGYTEYGAIDVWKAEIKSQIEDAKEMDKRMAAHQAYAFDLALLMTGLYIFAQKANDLNNAVTSFIKKNRFAIQNCVKTVKACVTDTENHFDVVDVDASQAKKSLLNLVYSFRIPDDEVVASTTRIWDNYLTRYSEATSEQEPQNVSLSRKPRPDGDRDTDGKLIFVSWEAGGGAGSDGGRDLIESLISAEQKSLSESYVGALRYNIVDLEDHPRSSQQKSTRGTYQDSELQGRRLKAQY